MTTDWRLAVDIGGTFTDVLLLEDGSLTALRVPSTPADPADAVLAGVRAVSESHDPDLLLHGSTVSTNALLERRGARVVLVPERLMSKITHKDNAQSVIATFKQRQVTLDQLVSEPTRNLFHFMRFPFLWIDNQSAF